MSGALKEATTGEVREGLNAIFDDLVIEGVGEFVIPPLPDRERDLIREYWAIREGSSDPIERVGAHNVCRLLAEIDRLRGELARWESASHPG